MKPARLVRLALRHAVSHLVIGVAAYLAVPSFPLYYVPFAVLLPAFCVLAAAGAGTVVGGDGIGIRRFFATRPVLPWSGIASVHEEQVRKAAVMELRTTAGKVVTLHCPVTAPFSPGPDFGADRDRIVAAWQRHGAGAGTV